MSDLPPPTSGLFLEISFRRLLKSCAEIMAGDNKGREDLTAWQRSPVFHHVRRGYLYVMPCVLQPSLPRSTHREPAWPVELQYVETLQEQLADLTATVGSKRHVRTGQQHFLCVDRYRRCNVIASKHACAAGYPRSCCRRTSTTSTALLTSCCRQTCQHFASRRSVAPRLAFQQRPQQQRCSSAAAEHTAYVSRTMRASA